MKTEMLYYDDFYIPRNITYPKFFWDCGRMGIQYDKLKFNREYRFYSNGKDDLLYIKKKYSLKPI